MIDLRSDVLAGPTPAMRRAMAESDSGDDGYDENELMRELERRVAQLLGKESSLFLPSGTMANALAILAQPAGPARVLMDRECHIRHRELGPLGLLAGLEPAYSNSPDGCPEPEDATAWLKRLPRDPSHPPLICVENTHLWRGGKVIAPKRLLALHRAVRAGGGRVHLDGSRLFHASAALDIPPGRFAEGADSVILSLVKGLGVPAGAMLAGPAALVRRAKEMRNAIGGMLRRSGWIAAAALVALDEGLAQIKEDNRRARSLAEVCHSHGFGPAPDEVESNMVLFDPAALGLTGEEFTARARTEGLLVSLLDPHIVRLATSRQVDDRGVGQAGEILRRIAAGARLTS